MFLHVLTKVLIKTVYSTSIFSLKCRWITTYTQAREHINSICFKWRTRLINN